MKFHRDFLLVVEKSRNSIKIIFEFKSEYPSSSYILRKRLNKITSFLFYIDFNKESRIFFHFHLLFINNISNIILNL